MMSAVWLIFALAASAADEKAENAATRDYAVAIGLQNKQLYPQASARWQKFIASHGGDARIDRAHSVQFCPLSRSAPSSASPKECSPAALACQNAGPALRCRLAGGAAEASCDDSLSIAAELAELKSQATAG